MTHASANFSNVLSLLAIFESRNWQCEFCNRCIPLNFVNKLRLFSSRNVLHARCNSPPLPNPRLKSATSSAVHMVDPICDFRETQAESHIFVLSGKLPSERESHRNLLQLRITSWLFSYCFELRPNGPSAVEWAQIILQQGVEGTFLSLKRVCWHHHAKQRALWAFCMHPLRSLRRRRRRHKERQAGIWRLVADWLRDKQAECAADCFSLLAFAACVHVCVPFIMQHMRAEDKIYARSQIFISRRSRKRLNSLWLERIARASRVFDFYEVELLKGKKRSWYADASWHLARTRFAHLHEEN
jgi:hypothetical protein